MAFTDEQRALLNAPLEPDMVSQRQQSGRSLSYLEGWEAIAQANTILGHDGWSHTITRLDYNPDVRSYLAIVMVRVHDAAGALLTQHEDVGFGIVAGAADKPESHETAVKGAVTDAMKRALRCLGDQFGNTLYDKQSVLHKTAGQPQRASGAAPQRDARPPAAPERDTRPSQLAARPAVNPADMSEVALALGGRLEGAHDEKDVKAVGADIGKARAQNLISESEAGTLRGVYRTRLQAVAVEVIR